MFIKPFEPGSRRTDSGPKSALLGFGAMGRRPWKKMRTLKKGPWKHWFAQRSGKVQNDDFQKFPTFYIKFNNFIENAKYFARFSQLFAFFGPARPGCARPYKTNAIPSLFRGFWWPGAHFPQNVLFCWKKWKCGIHDFLADFSFFDENQDFRENGGIAKTPTIP